MLAFFGRVCYYVEAVVRSKQNPGLAKFGIALEWGSRGRWFESSNSDQNSRNCICGFCYFLFDNWIRTHSSATVRWTVAANSANTVRYLDFCQRQKCESNPVTRTKNAQGTFVSCAFFLCVGFEPVAVQHLQNIKICHIFSKKLLDFSNLIC